MSAEFKSSLPPRKRAKTKEEKEQRRVERILRNRRAAHASREKKRKHVEYLESYVLKLESNIEKMRLNYKNLAELAGKDLASKATYSDLEDISELKEKIHLNLTGQVTNEEFEFKGTQTNSPSVEPENDYSDQQSKDEEENETSADASELSVKVEDSDSSDLLTNSSTKKRKYVDEDHLLVSKSNSDITPETSEEVNNYYNYLSPISINSPVNSPIDLTLKTEDLAPFTLDSNEDVTKGFNQLGQNSEVILSPRMFDSGFSISTY